MKTADRRCSSVSIVNFEHVIAGLDRIKSTYFTFSTITLFALYLMNVLIPYDQYIKTFV